MSLDLNKLANKLDEALSNETSETLTKFLTDKRMSNNKQSSIEWYAIEMAEYLRSIYGEGIVNIDILKQAKAMHKEEIIQAVYSHTLMNAIEEDPMGKSEQYYKETFGG